MKTVLVIGSGGREHALAWKLSQSPQVRKIIVAPGSDAFAWERWPANLAGPFEELAKRALEAKVDLVVVGPDNPLADGMVDELTAHGLKVFGPTRAAAKLEWSKAFSKEVMTAAGVPTAKYFVANTLQAAQNYLRDSQDDSWVIKADGLALGKGVHICTSREQALNAAEELFKISGRLVIEEKLTGEEISWMAFCDGQDCALLEPARDYKRVGDGDQGPNTGGMGAYSPVPGVDAGWAERIQKEVFAPMLAEMKKRGTPFCGLLYAGLMVDLQAGKYWVLEFNSRFGDPETQVLLPRLDGDLYDWCEATATGKLSKLTKNQRVPYKKVCAVVVIGAAPGYPDSPQKGLQVEGVQKTTTSDYFWAGVKLNETNHWVTSGGRVVGATGTGATFEEARSKAYHRLSLIKVPGMIFRTDIAKAVADLPPEKSGFL